MPGGSVFVRGYDPSGVRGDLPLDMELTAGGSKRHQNGGQAGGLVVSRSHLHRGAGAAEVPGSGLVDGLFPVWAGVRPVAEISPSKGAEILPSGCTVYWP